MADDKNERDEEEQQPAEESEEEFRFPSEDFQTSSEPGEASDQGSDFGLSGGSQDEGEEDEDDFGNLPPLSDFESADTSGKDEGGDESTSDEDDDFGGLPPLSDIQVDTPQPKEGEGKKPEEAASGGGAQGEAESGPAFDTPASDSDLDTPMPGDLDTPRGQEQTGFQDLQADSDFSPETPEIGPGPDSDLETPMFDSAFGGGEDLTPPQTSSTDAPTQAMETPMFGEEGGGGGGDDFGFDEGAFRQSPAGEFGGDQGTPVPDMSPDTGFPGGATPPPTPPPAEEGAKVKKKAKAGGGNRLVSVGVPVIIALVCLGIGAFVGPMIMGGPDTSELQAKDLEIQRLQQELSQLRQTIDRAPEGAATQNIQELEQQRVDLLNEIGDLNEQLTSVQDQVAEAEQRLELVQQDLNEKNNDFVQTQQDFEALQNQLSIERARQEGLQAEIERFQRLVGELEDANQRRMVTRDSLLHAVDRLAVIIREGSPLTPAKYSRADRISKVEQLRREVETSNWVSAQLLDQYSDLFLEELEIAQSREYFFAKLPLESRIGNVEEVWVEAVMNGNWSVFFRSLDGKKIGIYQNVAPPGSPPRYEFRQFLDNDTQDMVESEVVAARPADWQEKVQKIAERQLATDDSNALQRWYESL